MRVEKHFGGYSIDEPDPVAVSPFLGFCICGIAGFLSGMAFAFALVAGIH